MATTLYALPRAVALPGDLPPVMLPLAGVYERELFADRAGGYRWTNGAARALLPNPGGQVRLDLILAGGPGRTLPVTLTLNGQLNAFTVSPEPRHYRLLVPPGDGRRMELGIASPVLSGNGSERRVLGVVLGDMRVAGGGQAPRTLLLALGLATVGGFVLLRQAGMATGWTALATLVLQAIMLAWQTRWGWPYGLAEPLLGLIGIAGLAAVVVERWLLPRPASPLRFPQADGSAPVSPTRLSRRADPEPSSFWRQGASARPSQSLDGLLITFPSGGQRGWWAWGDTPGQALLLVLGIVLLALATRLPWLTAPDPVGDLELSARRMAFLARDGLAGAYIYDGDYLPLRLYMLLAMSRVAELIGTSFYSPLPAETLLLLKLPSLLADSLTITVIFFWGLRRGSLLGAGALAALYALTPPVWINVAWWGQVDGLLMLPMALAVLLLGSGRIPQGWAAWAIALLIKPQPILLAPLVFAVTLRRGGSRSLVQGGLLAAVLLVLGMLPLALAGQGPGMYQAYAGSVGRFPLLTNDAYNLWYLMLGGRQVFDSGQGPGGISYRLIGLLLLGAVALAVTLALLRRADASLAAHGAATLALAFFCLPTQIHQRYLFLVFAFLALRLADVERLTPLYALLALTGAINIFGSLSFIPWLQPWIAASPLGLICAVLNLLALAALLISLLRAAFAHTTAATYAPASDAPAGRASLKPER